MFSSCGGSEPLGLLFGPCFSAALVILLGKIGVWSGFSNSLFIYSRSEDTPGNKQRIYIRSVWSLVMTKTFRRVSVARQ